VVNIGFSNIPEGLDIAYQAHSGTPTSINGYQTIAHM